MKNRIKTNKVISHDEYDKIFCDTYEHCKDMLCKKGCYDSNVIYKFTQISVGVALKKAHVIVEKENV